MWPRIVARLGPELRPCWPFLVAICTLYHTFAKIATDFRKADIFLRMRGLPGW
jgi:hypothetical protein